jgi:hypothetical protein
MANNANSKKRTGSTGVSLDQLGLLNEETVESIEQLVPSKYVMSYFIGKELDEFSQKEIQEVYRLAGLIDEDGTLSRSASGLGLMLEDRTTVIGIVERTFQNIVGPSLEEKSPNRRMDRMVSIAYLLYQAHKNYGWCADVLATQKLALWRYYDVKAEPGNMNFESNLNSVMRAIIEARIALTLGKKDGIGIDRFIMGSDVFARAFIGYTSNIDDLDPDHCQMIKASNEAIARYNSVYLVHESKELIEVIRDAAQTYLKTGMFKGGIA